MSPARKPKPGDKLDAAPSRVRGYYTTPYGRFMSVTTLLESGVAKPELQWWYGNEAAKRAVDAIPKLSRLRGQQARDEATRWIAKAATEKRDAAADLGSWVHKASEAHILGAPHELPDDEQAPFMDAFHRFVEDHDPEFEATELTVAHPEHRWAGTADAWVRLRRSVYGDALVLIDYKTGRKARAEAALQLAAYRRATVGWLKDGTEVVPPAAEHAVVVHIRPDEYPGRGYAIFPLDTSDAVYASFLTIRDVALGWTRGLAKTALGEPLELAEPNTAEVA